MCNAYKHSWDCPCGFGGDTGGGRGRSYARTFSAEEIITPNLGTERRTTVSSYVNPNAHCPECGAPVFFYRSPYNGRVYFDELGWPWPKHPCTDTSSEPRRADPNSQLAREPAWRQSGWRPLLSARIHTAAGNHSVTGDIDGDFHDLRLTGRVPVDPDSPLFVRPDPTRPGLFEVTYLQSDHFGTHSRTSPGFEAGIAAAGTDVIAGAAAGDPAANHSIAKHLLNGPRCEDAIPYLEVAARGGIFDAQIELALLILLATPRTLH